MHPVLHTIGPIEVRMHNLMIAWGIMAGVLLTLWLARHKGRAYQFMLINFATYAIIGGLAGARIWEMAWTWTAYADRPWGRLAFWEGGMSIQGAVLGGLTVALIYARIKRLKVWEFLDILAPALVLGQGIGRIGCLFEGDAFGVPVSRVPWWPDWLGVLYARGTPAYHAFGSVPLVPAEALEGLAGFAICALLLRYRPRWSFPGWKALAYGILHSAVRFGLEFLRADSLTVGGLKVAQLVSLTALLACAALWAGRTARDQTAGL